MSNYLTRLVARTLAPVALRPRTRLLFEDAPALQPPSEELPPMLAAQAAPPVLPETASPRRRFEPLTESRSPFTTAEDRHEAAPAFESPRRETRVRADESPPRVAFERPRPTAQEEVRGKSRAEVVRVETPGPHNTTDAPARTIVETRESVVRERETVTGHDERIVHTRERVEPAPQTPSASPSRREGPRARPVVAHRATSRNFTPPPQQPPAPPEPTIQVSIGRIEVRATTQSAAPRRREAAAPALTLDSYLERRNGKSGR